MVVVGNTTGISTFHLAPDERKQNTPPVPGGVFFPLIPYGE
jgi:hypothetical protein